MKGTRHAVALVASAILALAIACAAGASPPNPAQNLPQSYPPGCDADANGTSTDCEIAAVASLDAARAAMGLSPYLLPPGFLALSPAVQLFILSNLDRLAYGLQPVAGLDSELDAAAAVGMQDDDDPVAPADVYDDGWSSNWAGDFPNALDAYDAWMYDDGLGSGNIDCTPTDLTGCWGHREDVFAFPDATTMSLGEAIGHDRSGLNSYAQLFVNTPPGVSYEYTWAQALALGTGSAGNADLAVSAKSTAKPVEQGTAARFTIAATDVNGGTAPAFRLEVTLPAGDPLVSAVPTAGLTCTQTSPTRLDCTQSVLFDIGATVTVTLRAAVVGDLTVSATVGYGFTDPNASNNTASATDAVVAGCTVPKVIGLTIKQATHAIALAHCRLIRTTFATTRSAQRVGRVVSQVPAAHARLIPNGGVRIVVGRATKR